MLWTMQPNTEMRGLGGSEKVYRSRRFRLVIPRNSSLMWPSPYLTLGDLKVLPIFVRPDHIGFDIRMHRGNICWLMVVWGAHHSRDTRMQESIFTTDSNLDSSHPHWNIASGHGRQCWAERLPKCLVSNCSSRG